MNKALQLNLHVTMSDDHKLAKNITTWREAKRNAKNSQVEVHG